MGKTKINKLGIYVTDDPIAVFSDPEINDTMKMCFDLVNGKRKSSSLRKLQRAIKKYPKIPQFWNYLSAYYGRFGRTDKAKEVNEKILKLFPDYIFGRTNYIRIILMEGLENDEFDDVTFDIDKIDKLFGESKTIMELDPNRDLFHVTEFVSYYSSLAIFEAIRENMDKAEDALDTLLEYLDEEDEEIQSIVYIVSLFVVKTSFKSFEHEKEVESFSTFPLPQTTEHPKLNHEILRNLYCGTFYVDIVLIDDIMALPKDTVIEDLLTIMYDSVRRFDFFYELYGGESLDGDGEWNESFPINAMYFLSVLGNESHLDDVLNLLRQGEEYLDFWFFDSIEELLLPVVFYLGNNQLDKLKSFLLEPNVYADGRVLVFLTVQQIAFHDTSRTEEILEWNKDFIAKLLEIGDDERILDTGFYSLVISKLTSTRQAVLLPEIKKMYDNNWIDSVWIGSYETVVKEMSLPFNPADIDPIPKNIKEFFSREYNNRRAESKMDYSDLEEKMNTRAAILLQKAMGEIISSTIM